MDISKANYLEQNEVSIPHVCQTLCQLSLVTKKFLQVDSANGAPCGSTPHGLATLKNITYSRAAVLVEPTLTN